MTANPAEKDTSQRILDIAARLVQTRGFNGFSYADIAAELQVSKASLHYHYPSKAALGRSLIERYERNFVEALDAIDRQARDEFDKLARYVRIYADVLGDQRMCLCGMLAAEHGTLPEAMQQVLKHYFDVNERWLASVLEAGRTAGVLRYEGAPRDVAAMLLGALEGAMMLARSYAEPKRFSVVADRLLVDLRVPAPARAARSRAAAPAGRAAVTAKRAKTAKTAKTAKVSPQH
jgi:TetR/AcrR family transcriptional regulator, transcriptional repressor for nem operon